MPRPDPDDLLALAERLAREASDLVRLGRAQGLVSVGTKSTRTDMVTEWDRASEALIVGGLRAERPHDAIVGEEGTADDGSTEVAWLVDPIDGTTNFLYDLPGYAVSIAARDAEGPLVGVVAVPALGEVFTAIRGRGAARNGVPIHASEKTELATALVATGFAYAPERRVEQVAVLQRLIGRVRDVRRLGAASADLCFVACGRLDAYYESGLGPWDIAAGELIAREAGAITSSFDGGPPSPAHIVAAAPGVHAALLAALHDAGVTGP